MRYYRGVNVKLDRSFHKHKKSNPEEWNQFREVIRICRRNSIDIRCFIKYCFLNRLVQHQKGRILKDICYLTHHQQLAAYMRDRENIEKCYRIYISILKTAMRMRNMAKERNEPTSATVMSVIGSEFLSNYITTGVVSRYFLALIPNMSTIIHEVVKRGASGDMDVLTDLCMYLPKYSAPAAKAMKMFWPLALNKSIIEICN